MAEHIILSVLLIIYNLLYFFSVIVRLTQGKILINRFLQESLLKIWDFLHECEKFRLFTSGA